MKTLRTAGMVVAAVALIATTAGLAAPAVAVSATAAASAGGVAGVSAATLGAIGAYGGLAAGVLSAVTAAVAPGVSSQGSATTFQTNPQSGLPYAMGRTRMSGLRFYANTNTRPGYTKFNDLLWFGALLSIGGQIDSIEKFTGDNELVTFDASGNAIGTYHDYQGQKIHLGGSPMASALALSLGGGTAPGWTTEHKLSGITHAMWCLRYNKQGEMYGAGAPEPAWIGKWVKVYDPRLDSTYPGGSGACRALQESTYVWSDNPGLHALTWSLGRWQNGKRTCGIGAPVANIRVAEFVECANVCDANGWKVGGVEWTTDSKWDTLKRILQAGGAVPTQTAAMIGCLVSMPRTAIATIESRHLLDNLSIAATKSRRDRFNTVIPRYVDEDSDWSVISGIAVTVPEYVAADKGQRTKEIDFPLVQVFSGAEAKQPGQLAAYEIVNSREAGPWALTVGPEFIGLQTGDVVNLNVPEEGLENQPVLIKQRGINPATGKVTFTVETETFAKHAFALGETTTPPAPWQLTAPDLKPPAPVATEWSVSGTTSGEGFPALLVAGDSEMPSADAIVIDYRLHAAGETVGDGWTNSAILSAVDTVRHVIAPLESQTAYDVRISYRVGTIDGDTTIFEQVVTGVGKITIIEGQLQDQDAALAELDADVAQAEIDIAAAQQTITDLQADAAATQTALTQAQNDILAQGAEIQAAQGDIIANATAISTVSSTVSSQGASITSLQQTASGQAGQISTLQQTVSTQGGSISSNATAITNLQGSVSTLSQTVSTQGGQISTNATAITTLQGTVSSLSTTVSTHGASITSLQTASTTQAGQIASQSLRINAETNPNLLVNGSFENGLNNWQAEGAWGLVSEGLWGSYAYAGAVADNTPRVLNQYVNLSGSVQLTISADFSIFGSGTGTMYVDVICVDSSNNIIFDSPQAFVNSGDFDASGASRQVNKTTFTTPANTARVVARVVGQRSTGSMNFNVRQVKLERGSQASSYSGEASVTQVYTAIYTTNTQVASLQTTVSTQGASITSNSTAITTLQTQTANLSIQVSAGNPNLLANSSFQNGFSSWTAHTSYAFNIGNTGAWGTYAVTSTNASDPTCYIYQDVAGPENDWYTATADMGMFLSGSGAAGVSWVEIQWLDSTRTQVLGVGRSAFRSYGNNFDPTGAARQALKCTSQNTYSAPWLRVVYYWQRSGGNVSSYHIRQCQLVRGSVLTPYSQEATVLQAFSALSTLTTQYASLSTTVSTQGVTITSQQTAITTINNNVTTLYGRAALTIEAGGVITGWEVNNNGTTGDIKLRADRVSVVTATGGTKTFEIRQGTIIGYYPNGQKMYQLGDQSVA